MVRLEMKCDICGKPFDKVTDRNLHIFRSHRMKIVDFVKKYEPRFDLFTKEPITYKNYEDYSHRFFNNRANLVKYYKTLSKDKVNEVTTNILRERREQKGITVAPSTVCARLAILPSPLLVNTCGGDYNKAAVNAGLKPRFDYDVFIEYGEGELDILQDTREQNPLGLLYPVIRTSLDFGDYVCKQNPKVFIERKSLVDLAGTLSAGFERFCREMERAKEMDATIIVLVEEDLNNLLSINYLPHTKKVKASPDFLGHRIRDIVNRFDNVQFLFVGGRVEAARILDRIFRIKNNINKIDFQMMYDFKKL